MWKRVLAKAVATAVATAKTAGADLVCVAVREPYPAYADMADMQGAMPIPPVLPKDFEDMQQRLADHRVQEVLDVCAEAGVKCEGLTPEAHRPWEAILDVAREKKCDVIVMASHGRRGLSALVLGSETQRVLTHSTVPVIVIK